MRDFEYRQYRQSRQTIQMTNDELQWMEGILPGLRSEYVRTAIRYARAVQTGNKDAAEREAKLLNTYRPVAAEEVSR